MHTWKRFCLPVAVVIVASLFGQAQVDKDASDEENTDGEVALLRHRAEAGDSGAQYEIGLDAEQNGDYREAFKWFQLAAEQGVNGAQVDLAYLYGTGFGTRKDLEQAVHWYRLAAAQNNPNAEYSLGLFYLHGEGLEQDLALARKWISLALRDGDGARSENEMGLTYETGPELDLQEALKWYSRAAESGYRDAQYNVCRLTAQGLAVPSDYSAALKWCETLAEKGDLWGEYGMGLICEKGVRMPPDLKAAAQWYNKSAEQGHPDAQLRLGAMYAQGKGIRQDFVHAYMWVALAGAQKHPEALEYLRTLTSKMTKAQIAAGQALAGKWAQSHPLDPESSSTLDHMIYNRP